MSNKTPETIWKFESPEALAQALEDKNKALAERVREISKKSIETDSKDLRKALQEELSPTEQKEMREALPDAGISEVFTKWMTTEEQAIQKAKESASEMLWEDNTKALQKVEWIWNRLSTGMDKIGDIFEQKWMMAGIWAIILMFKWIFSWDFSALDNILNPKKDDEKKESENKGEENLKNNIQYTAWISLIIKAENFSDYTKRNDSNYEQLKIDWNIQAVFLNTNFNKLKFSQLDLPWLSSNKKNWISKKLWINDLSDEEVYNTLLLLKRRETFLDKILKDKQPNWRDLSIKEIVLNLHRYSSFFNWLNNLDFEKLTTSWTDFIKLNFKENNSWPLNEMLESQIKDSKSPFYWVSKVYLAEIYSISWNHNFDKNNLLLWNEKNNDFINNFLEFRKNLPNLLKTWFFAWKREVKDNFDTFINENISKLSPSEILEYFVITNWKTIPEQLNDAQNSMIFTKLFFLLNKQPKLQWETYLYAMKEWIYKSSDNIPPALQNAIWLIFKTLWEKLINSTLWMTQRLWGMLDTTEKAVAIWWSILALAWAIRFMQVTAVWRWLASWLSIWAWAFIVAQVYHYFEANKKDNPDYQAFKRENNIRNQKDFEQVLLKVS